MPPVIIGPRCNRRVTCDDSIKNDRSESALAVNPKDPLNMVGSSKRFTDPRTYCFSLAAYYTFDGGQSWKESSPLTLQPGWAGASDPAVAFDDVGNAYLVALPFRLGTPTDCVGDVIGIAVYKSTDGGRTWSAPNLIHSSSGDDKQWAAGDVNPASPHYGNVYAAWDDGGGVGNSQLSFARTMDHGATWKGIGSQPAGVHLPGINDSGAPELSVATDGTVYIVWVTGNQIKFVKSTDGGDSFSDPAIVATGITPISSSLPGGKFRTFTLPTGCTGKGKNVIFAWADYREGVSRIYYRRSSNGGSTWQGPTSGQPLLTGAVASPSNLHDFHPQLISTPAGEIGCAFYEFGPMGSGEFPPNLINVILAVSTDNGATFPNRVTVTDQAWDPTVDEVWAHGNPNVTFIGDYFGLDASRLGFFPFWTDTRTGIQEIFTSRIAVNPADVYIRDSSSDIGDVPSPGDHWEYVDLIVRRQPDGDTNFVNEDLLRDGVTDHYVYGRVTNRGPNDARNVKLAVAVGNWPSLLGLPNAEFRYPQEWYQGDWDSAPLHMYLGESAPTTVANGTTKIIGPVVWPASQIPDPALWWHPCLLAEVRTDNDDSAGGLNGCPIPAEGDTNSCNFGSFFWGNNNACQRNLSFATVAAEAATLIDLPFLVGSVFSKARFLEVIVDKGPELAETPMTLRMEPICPPGKLPKPFCPPGKIVFSEKCRVKVQVDDCDVGEIIASPGTVWQPHCPPSATIPMPETCHGGDKVGDEWKLTRPKAAVGFPIARGEMRKMTLSIRTPTTLKLGTRMLLRIFQRNDKRVITSAVLLELEVGEAARSAQTTGSVRPARTIRGVTHKRER